MQPDDLNPIWYYVGHYGQLGPLTLEQFEALIESGVIERETYVWAQGMSDWVPAKNVPELQGAFPQVAPSSAPPPFAPQRSMPQPTPQMGAPLYVSNNYGALSSLPVSNKSRVLAGVLQLLLPGVGRMYLGYVAQGIIQLFMSFFCFGIGWLWSVIDGILLLVGNVKLDGYGRRLAE